MPEPAVTDVATTQAPVPEVPVPEVPHASVEEALAALRPVMREAVEHRMAELARALSAATGDRADLLRRLSGAVGGHDVVWLVLAVLRAALPEEAEVLEAWRWADLEGAEALLAREVTVAAEREHHAARPAPVRVVLDAVVVDVDRTARFDTATGIQRVARQVVADWSQRPGVHLVAWTGDQHAMRLLSGVELARATGRPTPPDHEDPHGRAVVVPWRCTVVLPEVPVEQARSDRLRALARAAGSTLRAIGFDTIPVTSAETTDVGVSGHTAWYLSALRWADRVAAISDAAAEEFGGFADMLAAQGLPGPRVVVVPLPLQLPVGPAAGPALGRAVGAGHLPTVLCVGSQEPRKNHLAVLHAAELLWRDGHRFFLTFIGGAGWRSQDVDARVLSLQSAGRPVHVLRQASEDELWAAYRTARLLVFPSLHEGYGLPVAEALAVGTPVVTSDLGSLRDLAAAGGVLLVDPQDESAIAGAVGRLLTDDALHARLSAEGLARAGRGWQDYADELWDVLVT